MALGNVIGSSVFNILGILGVVSVIHPIAAPQEIAVLDIWIMLGVTLLVLVPVVVVAALAVMLLGFTGVAQGVGQLMTRGDSSGRWTAVAVFWLGLVLLMIPTLSGVALSLAGGSFRVIAITLGLIGFVAEYAAWTTGVGAVILNRFGASAGPQAGPPPMPVPPPVESGPIV